MHFVQQIIQSLVLVKKPIISKRKKRSFLLVFRFITWPKYTMRITVLNTHKMPYLIYEPHYFLSSFGYDQLQEKGNCYIHNAILVNLIHGLKLHY